MSDVTPIQPKRNVSSVISDGLRSFPAVLAENDSSAREVLIMALQEAPKSYDRWQLFLWNEKKLLEKFGIPLSSLESRVKLAKFYLASDAAEFLEVDLMATTEDKRESYANMAKRGSKKSRLFLSWAELEASENKMDVSVKILEKGLSVVDSVSPNRGKLEEKLRELKLIQSTQSPMPSFIEEQSAPKTGKGRVRPRRLLGLGGIAKASRVKQGEQQAKKEEEVSMTNERLS